jgi:hypothetical protein
VKHIDTASGGVGGGGGGALRSQEAPGDPIYVCHQEVLCLATPYLF